MGKPKENARVKHPDTGELIDPVEWLKLMGMTKESKLIPPAHISFQGSAYIRADIVAAMTGAAGEASGTVFVTHTAATNWAECAASPDLKAVSCGA